MNVLDHTVQNICLTSWVWIDQADVPVNEVKPLRRPAPKPTLDILRPLRHWIDRVEVGDRQLAHRLCKFIPAQCPFERDVKFFGHTLFHIPPMCKLNPLYEEVVALRFRALCYLADECGEDVTPYC